MTKAVIKTNIVLLKVFQGNVKHFAHIFFTDATSFHIYNVIETASFVHSQGKGTILISISKGKLHLVSIVLFPGASYHALIKRFKRISDDRSKQAANLFFLQLHLLFVAHFLIQAATAFSKVRTNIFFVFQNRGIQHRKKTTFCFVLSGFFYGALHHLS